MTEGDVLLRDVLERPGDDVPRLVYADWLEDNGESVHAEMIRGQVAEGHARVTEWNEDEPVSVSRGFVWRVAMTRQAFMTHAESLFRKHPITEVKLTNKSPITNVVGLWPDLDSHRKGDRSGWLSGGDQICGGEEIYRWYVPRQLFKLLPSTRSRKASRGCRAWDTPEEALDALSDACVRYGRGLAGLPPI